MSGKPRFRLARDGSIYEVHAGGESHYGYLRHGQNGHLVAKYAVTAAHFSRMKQAIRTLDAQEYLKRER